MAHNYNQAGRLLRVALAWTQLAAGISQPILTDTKTNLPHLKVRWLSSLRTFLHSIEAEIELDRDHVPPLQRQYDEHIMDQILVAEAFSDTDINILNNCRMYLQAATIADLSTVCGTRLDPFLLQGQTSLLSSTTKWITINQARPNESAWRKWQSAMRIWSRDDGTLYRPLGAWLVPGDSLRRTWPFYKDLSYPFLYVNTPHGFLQYADEDHGRYSNGIPTPWRPTPNSIPVHADAILNKDAWMITTQPQLQQNEFQKAELAHSFEDYL